MMDSYDAMIREFMAMAGQRAPTTPDLTHFPAELRAKLVLEEAMEFVQACGYHLSWALDETPAGGTHWTPIFTKVREPDLVAMIDAVCDGVYVGIGAMIAAGVPTMPFFKLVHRANMAKQGGPMKDGKQMKPVGWVAPEASIEAMLKRMKRWSASKVLRRIEQLEDAFLAASGAAPSERAETDWSILDTDYDREELLAIKDG